MLMVVISSCGPTLRKKEVVQEKPTYKLVTKTTPVEKWLIKFVKSSPNFLNNDATKSEANQELLKALKDSTNKDWIDEIPVELKTISRVDGKYVAQFGSYLVNCDYTFRTPIKSINFDVIATIPDSVVSTLKDDVTYKLYGSIVSPIDNVEAADVLLGAGSSYWSNNVGFEMDAYSEGAKSYLNVNLGILFCDISKVVKFIGRDKVKIQVK